MKKKKKEVITIKTSLKSVLLDNEAAEEFKETLDKETTFITYWDTTIYTLVSVLAD